MDLEVNEVIEPVGFGLEVAAKVLGISRAKAYLLASSGELKVKKVGSRSITTRENCQDCLDAMPDFTSKNVA